MQLLQTIRWNGRAVRKVSALLGLCGAVNWAGLAGAAPPANDTCAGAVVIPAASFPYLTPVLTNIHEATLNGDPHPSTNCAIGVARGVWYSFTPNQSGTYTFSTGHDTATTAFDTILSVIAAPTCANVTNEVACNDDSGAFNNRAGLEVNLAAGTHYFVLVWLSGADNNPEAALHLQIRVDRPQLPVNDTCATAEVIPTNLGFPRKSATNDTVRAGTEADEPSCAAGFRSVWYKFTPPTTNTYILSTGIETATTVFDTLMVLYSTASDCAALTEVACSDNGEGRGSLFRTLNGGTTYYIAIHDESEDPIISETIVQLSIATPTAPSVTTLPMVSISSTGAVLRGIVNPSGLQSRLWIEWGPTAAYGTATPQPARFLFPGVLPITNDVVVSGFAANTTYHYRMVATNLLGRAEGFDQTFVWTTNRPALTGPERLASGNFRFSFSGNSRQIYSIETSTNLTNWSYQGAATESPAGSGSFTYTHVGAGSIPRRFYRVNSP